MIYLMTGLPGAGKTIFTLNRVLTDPQLINREVYYHGIPELKLPWNKLEESRKWYECPDGAVIVIDEAQKTFPGRPSGAMVPQWVSEFETHRHRGQDIVLITQEPGLIDAHVRKLVERHFALVRPFGLWYCKLFEFHGVGDPKSQTDVKGAIQSKFKHPKYLYDKYKSATLHAVKPRVPVKALTLPLVFALLCGIGYYTYQRFFGSDTVAARAGAVAQSERSPAGARPSLQQGLPRSLPEYLDQFTPRHPDVPSSAPIYDHLVAAVKDFPRIMGCMKSEGKCWCYSQQGTKLDLRPQICYAFMAQGGFFDPYREPRRSDSFAPALAVPKAPPAVSPQASLGL